MQAFLDSSSDPIRAEATVTEEARVFRAEIVRWAARQLDCQGSPNTTDGYGKAAANLRSWSREYFHTAEKTEARGISQ
jgi:hypothetical protein